MFNKGVPSTFANLKHLYADESKKSTLPAVVEEYLESIDKEQVNGDSSKGKGAALYFLAQHYDYYLSRDLAKATEYVDKALELDPKNVDFAMTKARIWKHHGNLQKASEAMEHARTLDTRDRYINTKAAKYKLRNDEIDNALETMGMFTKADTVGGPLADLLDMQSVWYLTEDGESQFRQGNIGLALKRFHTILTIFDIWQEDQFDFHSFSLRKGLIRAYIDMIRWEDHLRDHPFFSRAAIDAVKVYLRLYDQQNDRSLLNGVNGDAGDKANGEDALEKKKAVKKAKKDAQRQEREAAEKAAKQDPNKTTAQKGKQDAAEALKKKDDDPLGQKLMATPDPLGVSMKFVGPLLQFCPKSIEAQTTAFEVLILRSKRQRFPSSPLPLYCNANSDQRNMFLLFGASTPLLLLTLRTPRHTSRPYGSDRPWTRTWRPCLPRWPRFSRLDSLLSLWQQISRRSTRNSERSTRTVHSTCCQRFACKRSWEKTRPSYQRTWLAC